MFELNIEDIDSPLLVLLTDYDSRSVLFAFDRVRLKRFRCMPRRTVVIEAEEANPAAFAMFCSFVEFCDCVSIMGICHGILSNWLCMMRLCMKWLSDVRKGRSDMAEIVVELL